MSRPRTILLAATVFVMSLPSHSAAQGTFGRRITFDGSPEIPRGHDIGVTYYYEDSMTFRPINPGEQFGRAGGEMEGFPENGTAYIIQGAFDSLSGSRGGWSRFGLYSVDLSEFSRLYQVPRMVQFIGYRTDGNVVTAEFTTDGIMDGTGPLSDFQTFYFDNRFSDLLRFEVPSNTFALDNLVFYDVIPEPGAIPLLALGAGIFCTLRLRTRKSTAR